MSLLLRVPAVVLCCLVLPAYILLFLILLDTFSLIVFTPQSVPFDELVPFLISFSLTTFAAWQFAIIRKAYASKFSAFVYLLVAGFNLFLCSFILLAATEQLIEEITPTLPFNFDGLFRIIRDYTSENTIIIIILSGLLASPLITALALTTGLEKRSSFLRWLVAALLVLFFPLGIWWLQPRVRAITKAPAADITEHFGF